MFFQSLQDMYRKTYFEIFDQVLMTLKIRFETDVSQFFKSLETFAIGITSDINKIIGFYDDDFDKDRWVSDRDMFLNLMSRNNETIRKLKEAVEFLRENEYTMGILPECVRFIRLMPTITGSSCTNERCFSAVRR